MATERQVPKPLTTSTSPVNAESQNFTYTIKNEMVKPFFDATIQLPITPGKRLIDYMQVACGMDSDKFSGFTVTYYPDVPGGPGYFVDYINGVSQNLEQNHQTYWKISNNGRELDDGVSLYEPSHMDQILFNLTKSIGNH